MALTGSAIPRSPTLQDPLPPLCRTLRRLPCRPQIAKLLVIPFVCLVERFFMGSVFSRQVLGTIVLVVLGVGIV